MVETHIEVARAAIETSFRLRHIRNLVRETSVPAHEWRHLAESLVREYVGCKQVDADLLDWITHK